MARAQGPNEVTRQHVAEHPQSIGLQGKSDEDPLGDVLSVSGIHPHAASRITADLGMGRVRNVRVPPPTPANLLVRGLQRTSRGVACKPVCLIRRSTEALGTPGS